MKKYKEIPDFKSEVEEREFWSKNDSTEYVNWEKAEKITFANLKPSTKTISLRVPEYIIEELKMLAHKMDVPYQSLIKTFLRERINKELKENNFFYTP